MIIKSCFSFLRIAFIPLFLLLNSVHAVEVKNLYQAKVPVSSQTKAQRSIATKKAMESVLIKIGGLKANLNNAVIKSAIKKHSYYLSQYSYTREVIPTYPYEHTDIKVLNEVPTNEESLLLVASFDEDKINQLLQSANVPIWGRLRPQVLIWIVEEDNLSRTILSDSSESNYPFIAEQLHIQRGLPVTIPLMDFTDATQVSITDLWGRFEEPVNMASERYKPDAVVVVRVSNNNLAPNIDVDENCEPDCNKLKTTFGYSIDWSLFTGVTSKRSQQVYQGTNSELLLSQALSDLTDTIYNDYALISTTDTDNNFIIDVANITSITQFVTLTEFLTDLSSVNSVKLLSAEGENRRLSLNLLGSSETFLSSIKLDNKLNQYVDPLAETDDESVPVFYWGKL